MSTSREPGPSEPGPRQPDETRRVAIDGHEVVSYSYGSGEQVVFLRWYDFPELWGCPGKVGENR